MQVLFPEIKPYARHELGVSDIHTLYVDEAGNADGIPDENGWKGSQRTHRDHP